jgi:hypothetical protein
MKYVTIDKSLETTLVGELSIQVIKEEAEEDLKEEDEGEAVCKQEVIRCT